MGSAERAWNGKTGADQIDEEIYSLPERVVFVQGFMVLNP